ncbi:hypothetical protein V500_07764 [Pseudogymnoascus sp. VKM F-4518 (FW-2643)]|nr:hypothetical protein V500_07764 [Pseudogymnoascus sp. VKM F-4518 (FW-2643)]
MAEVIGLVASFIAIGQALAAVPQLIDTLRSLADMKKELASLVNELELLRSSKEYIDDALNSINPQVEDILIPRSEHAFVRTVRAQLQDIMDQLSKLVADCHRGLDKKGRPRPARLKWLWKKNKHSAVVRSKNGQALLDVQSKTNTSVETIHQSLQSIDKKLRSSPASSPLAESLLRSIDTKITDISGRIDQLTYKDKSENMRQQTVTLHLSSDASLTEPMSTRLTASDAMSASRRMAYENETIPIFLPIESVQTLGSATTDALTGLETVSSLPGDFKTKTQVAAFQEEILQLRLDHGNSLSRSLKDSASLGLLHTPTPDIDGLKSDNYNRSMVRVTASGNYSPSCAGECDTRSLAFSTPSWLVPIVGKISADDGGFISSWYQHRNRNGCLQHAPTLEASYRFPYWFLHRTVNFSASNSTPSGPVVTVDVVRVINSTNIVWDIIRNGDNTKLKEWVVSELKGLNDTDEDGTTLLYASLLSRQYELAQFLHGAGARTDQRSAELARDILSYTHRLNELGALDLEMLHKLKAEARDTEEGRHFRAHSAAKGLYDMDEQLESNMSHGARYDLQALNQLDDCGKAPLHWACQGGNTAALTVLLSAGADVNIANIDGETPLMVAAHRGDTDAVRLLLLVKRCDFDKKNRQGRCKGAFPRVANSGRETPLHELASSLTAKVPIDDLKRRAEALIGGGARLEAIDHWGYTATLQAVVEDNHAALCTLIGLGARLNHVDRDKQGVLHLSALHCSFLTIQTLQDAKITELDIESLDYQEDTPYGLFEWRMEGRLSAITPWRTPTREEWQTFVILLRGIQDRNLVIDVRCCQLAIRELEFGDDRSAIHRVDNLIERYAQWLKDEEFETFRTIKLKIIEHARRAAIQALEDTIKIWESRRRMPLYHMGPFACKILDSNADDTI